MNKDNVVLAFESDKDIFGDVSFTELYRTNEKLPLSFWDLKAWLDKRQAPKHRAHISSLLKVCGCYDLDGFLRVSHALSLNDTYWVKEDGSNLMWKDVSLFRNPFNDVIARIAFEGGIHGDQFSTTSPELGTDGAFAKCWIRDGKGIYLLKRGSSGASNAGLEPYSEYYASQISRFICNKSVEYDLTKYHGKVASKCALFTSESVGFAPIWKLIGFRPRVRDIVGYYDSIGCGEDFRRMLVFDALILNTDRHLGNYGVLVDNDTRDILGMAPVFDNNLALLPYLAKDDYPNVLEYIKSRPTKIGNDFNEMAHWALTPKIKRDLINLKGFKFDRSGKYNLPEDRLKVLESVVNMQIDNILNDVHLYVESSYEEV